MPAMRKKKDGGSQLIQRVDVRRASESEAERIETAVDRLLAELVCQVRDHGRKQNESGKQQ